MLSKYSIANELFGLPFSLENPDNEIEDNPEAERGSIVMQSDDKKQFVIGVLSGQKLDSNILAGIMKIMNLFPQCDVDIRKEGHALLIKDLLEEKMDLAITLHADGDAPNEDLDYWELSRVRMHLFAKENDPVWTLETNLNALDRRILIIQGDDHPAFSALIKCIKAAGVLPHFKVAPSPVMVAHWLETGVGLSVADEGEIVYSELIQNKIPSAPLQGVPDLAVVMVKKKGNTSCELDMFTDTVTHGCLQ